MFFKHGYTRTPTWNSWWAMRRRAVLKSAGDVYYANVACCKRWNNFENFLCDMGKRPSGKTLDRLDPRKGYSKKNCRWVTLTEQIRNRKPRGLVKYLGVVDVRKFGYVTKPYRAQIRDHGKTQRLGYYRTAEEASRVYQAARRRIEGVVHGRA